MSSPIPETPASPRILVISLAGIGDTLIATPFIHELRANAAGSAALANSGHGITLESSTGAATIGGASGTLRNIVSGNGDDGIHIELASAATTSGIDIAGTFVGVAGDGSTTLANASDGIDVQLGSGITIGGTVGAIGNVIAGNGANGIEVEGASQAVAILGISERTLRYKLTQYRSEGFFSGSEDE